MITSLALVPLLVLVWFTLALPLAVLIGRCISVGQSRHAAQAAAAGGRLTRAAVQAGNRAVHEAGSGSSRTAAA